MKNIHVIAAVIALFFSASALAGDKVETVKHKKLSPQSKVVVMFGGVRGIGF